MKLRKYLPSKDFDNIKSWIDDERTHAMWCAGRFEYPLEKENFEAVLEDMHSKWGDTPFIASKGCSLMNIGIVEENTRLRKWYEDNGAVHVGTKKFNFFPFTCGYMKKEL